MTVLSSKHTIFIADLHLHSSQPEKALLFSGFLKQVAAKADALYILGDLFELWVGDDDETEFTRNIAALMREFQATNKIPIYLMRGNRDFLLGKKFALASGCHLIADPKLINLYGTRILLTHGDSFYANDIFYRCYHAIISGNAFKKIFLRIPLTGRKKIGTFFRNISQASKKIKRELNIEWSRDKINKILQKKDATLLIHGHLHQPKIQKLAEGKQQVILGEWTTSGSYLIYDDKRELKLLFYP